MVEESKEILLKHNIDWYKDIDNLVIAKNHSHTYDYTWVVWRELKEVEGSEALVRAKLNDLGKRFANPNNDKNYWAAQMDEWIKKDAIKAKGGVP